MKYLRNLLLITSVLLFAVSCDDFSLDLEVPNYEHPNDQILTSDPVAMTATAGTLINNWYMACHNYYGPGSMLGVMSDAHTCSWGNVGMRDMSEEPRIAFNNKPSYTYYYTTNNYFNSLYAVLSDANNLVKAVEDGNTDFEDPDLILMMGKAGEALAIGHLAMVFDRVWLADENGPVNEDGTSSDYATAMAFALEKLDDAIALAGNTDLPSSWIPGGGGEATKFKEFLNTLGARMLVGNVRNKAEKAQIDWSKVLTYANAGVTEDYSIYMDNDLWWSDAPHYCLMQSGWGRTDMYVVHLMDPNQPSTWPDGETVLDPATSDDARLLSDYEYLDGQDFRPDRGSWHFSSYRYSRYDWYLGNWVGDLVEIAASENDMYKAEALLNSGNVSGAADVVNAGTRVTRGNLPPVAADATAVADAIHYERMVEFAYTGMALPYFEMRKEDLLQKGSPLHFPVPGKQLESIPEDIYTYGGTQGVAGQDYSNGGWK